MDNYHKTGDQKIPTRMFCQICGHLHKIDFWVPDEIWNEAIHPRWRDTHVCLNCFMERADERLLEWDEGIVLMPCSMASQIKIQQGPAKKFITHFQKGKAQGLSTQPVDTVDRSNPPRQSNSVAREAVEADREKMKMSMPTGEVKAWDFILWAKNHFESQII